METTKAANRSSSKINHRKSPTIIEGRGGLEQLGISISKQGQWLRLQTRFYPQGETVLSASRTWLEYNETDHLA